MTLSNGIGQSHATTSDIFLFILCAGLIGGFMYGSEWGTAKELALMLMSAMFGYARGRK